MGVVLHIFTPPARNKSWVFLDFPGIVLGGGRLYRGGDVRVGVGAPVGVVIAVLIAVGVHVQLTIRCYWRMVLSTIFHVVFGVFQAALLSFGPFPPVIDTGQVTR